MWDLNSNQAIQIAQVMGALCKKLARLVPRLVRIP
jgi:hypothetical protein